MAGFVSRTIFCCSPWNLLLLVGLLRGVVAYLTLMLIDIIRYVLFLEHNNGESVKLFHSEN